jgi:hypothetical protein
MDRMAVSSFEDRSLLFRKAEAIFPLGFHAAIIEQVRCLERCPTCVR